MYVAHLAARLFAGVIRGECYNEIAVDPGVVLDVTIPDSSSQMEVIREEIDRLSELLNNTFSSFNSALTQVLATKKYSFKNEEGKEEKIEYPLRVVAARSGLDIRSLKDYLSGRNTNPTLESILAIGIGLNLHPEIIFSLIDKSSHRLTHSSLHIFYKYLVWNHHQECLDSWNQKLREAGFDRQLPKGRLVPESKK